MATLFRFQPRPGALIDPRLDQRIDLPKVRIGRSGDSDLRLLRFGLRYDHATIRVDGAGVVVEPAAGATIGPAASPVTSARLANPGDSVRVGPYVLTLQPPDPALDADRIIVLLLDEEIPFSEIDRAAGHVKRFSVRLPNVRLWAFGLSVAVFVLCFVLPLVLAPTKGDMAWTTKEGRAAADRSAENAPFRFASLWNVGRISNGHQAFATNCAACHETGFVRVRSSACLDCHQTTGQHADPHLAPAADLNKERCESCHHEHKGMTLATRNDQSDCVSCHGDIRSFAPQTHLHDVRDFGHDHPQFSPALVQDAGLHKVERFELGDPKAEDHANLRFTHARHFQIYKVAAKGVATDATCAQCHEAAPGGLVFKPVSFEDSCASCHKLQFEPKHPEWRLPHGHREEIVSRVEGYYAQAALAGETFAAPRSDLFSKPGTLPPATPLTGAAMVSAQTAATMIASIANSACGECHTIAPPAASEPATDWKILPVWVPDNYLTKAKFSHDKHLTMGCQDCHAAGTSNGGVMTLLPGIETCRSCHSGEAGASQRVASRCVTCHGFHDNAHPMLAAPATPSKQAASTSLFGIVAEVHQ